jgi:hypothetical protein
MARVTDAPEPLALIRVIVAMFGQVAVSDPRDDQQRRTWRWLKAAAIARSA